MNNKVTWIEIIVLLILGALGVLAWRSKAVKEMVN